ncbi:MAG: S41 family peptidase [Prevotellaceae bacterium]|jgi:carboxyl-terminal processing protease|nr:S41 family peptidase [Prevotellaceae bacterium]
MSYPKKIVTLWVVAAMSIPTATAQSRDFEYAKSIDIFMSALNELQNEYVDSLSVDKLIKYALDGITENLDPYTEYVPAEQQKDFDFQTTGRYAGIGSMIQKDSNWVIISSPYKDFPAQRAGLVSGDKIIEIDGQNVENFTTEKVSNMLRGDANTVVRLKVIKFLTNKIEELAITRENIRPPAVPYYGLKTNGTAYIRLTSFIGDGCGVEVRNALKQLRATGEMKSLILDLRGNPGGLLREAVKVVNLFVPKGVLTVSVSGYKKNSSYKYTTTEEPLEPELPLVVLVDNFSASASEIVSGAIQDLDRGIVLGSRTYGKGYVQGIRQLGYDAQLKLTTAKYYIPSGRCIQAHNFTTRNSDGSIASIPDSLKKEFKTKNGRKVYDGGGINPDIMVKDDELSPIAISLLKRNLIFKYSLEYFKKHPTAETPDKFQFTDKDYQDFTDYLKNKEYDYQTLSEQLIKRLVTAAKQEKYYEAAKTDFDKLNEALKHDKLKDLNINEAELKMLLMEEIAERYWYEAGKFEILLRSDKQFDEACNILANRIKYENLLKP